MTDIPVDDHIDFTLPAGVLPDEGTKGVVTTSGLEVLLRLRFPRSQYALLFGVHDGAGFDKTRTCDALAMSLWPSRGLHLYGFELKASRADWLRELKNPAKAEPIMRYVDLWWIVAGSKDIVKLDELPPGWGLLAPGRGGQLHTYRSADLRNAVPPDRSFLAALLKKSVEQSVDAEELKKAREAGHADGEKNAKLRLEMADRELKDLQKRAYDFERASGISLLRSWEGGTEIGAAVKMVLSRKHSSEEARLRQLLQNAKEIVSMTEKTLAALTPETPREPASGG